MTYEEVLVAATDGASVDDDEVAECSIVDVVDGDTKDTEIVQEVVPVLSIETADEPVLARVEQSAVSGSLPMRLEDGPVQLVASSSDYEFIPIGAETNTVRYLII